MTARALVVDRKRLLVVSDEGEYWYLPGGRLEPDWVDSGGEVSFRKFMTRDEIRRRGDVHPAFLAEGAWLDGDGGATYMGFERG